MKLPTVLFKLAFLCPALHASVGHAATEMEQHSAIQKTAETFATQQATAALGKDARVKAVATPIDARLNFPSCPQLIARGTSGASRWGRTTVEISCASPRWRVYVPVLVSAKVTYPVAGNPLPPGHILSRSDLATATGDITQLPSDVILEEATVEGRKLATSISLGKPLRLSALARENAVTAGQRVKLIVAGNGFTIAAEGTATASAGEGEYVRVIGPNGKPVGGRARAGGTVDVSSQ